MKRIWTILLTCLVMSSILIVFSPEIYAQEGTVQLTTNPCRTRVCSMAANGSISAVKASSSTYQGDLILTGNNVTMIQGRFDINGSILVEENATLILQDAVVNLIQSTNYEYNITFRNPVNGNPRLQSNNSLVTSNLDLGTSGHRWFKVSLLQNSSATLFNTTDTSYLEALDNSTASILNSTIRFANMEDGSSFVSIANSTISYAMNAGGSCIISVSNSTILGLLNIISYGANCSINGLEPGFFTFWDYRLNCSVDVAPLGLAPNVTLRNTAVEHWQFDINAYPFAPTHATITDSKLASVFSYNRAVVQVVNSTVDVVQVSGDGRMSLVDSTVVRLAFTGGSATYLLSDCTLTVIEFHGGNGYIAGNATFKPSSSAVWWWGTGNLTRNFNVIVEDVYGEFVSNATLILKSEDEAVVWSGITDTQGTVCFNLTFTEANYPGTLKLEASKQDFYAKQNVSIISDTPVMLTWELHNVAITDVAPSKTIVGQGYNLVIDVLVTNRGDCTETFSVTLYSNATTIGIREVPSLSNGTSTTLTFTWNTSGFTKGNYSLWAYAEPVPGETETADNTVIGGWVTVTIPGDVDGDRDVDIFDIVRMAGVYGIKIPDSRYDPNSDIDGDGDIDIFDIVVAAGHYGESW